MTNLILAPSPMTDKDRFTAECFAENRSRLMGKIELISITIKREDIDLSKTNGNTQRK